MDLSKKSAAELRELKKRNRIRDRSPVGTAVIYIISILIAFITVYPMYYVLILSLSSPHEALTMRVYWWPKGFFTDGYRRILTDAKLWVAYRNTIMYCSVRAVLNLATSVMVAYPLTVKKLYGRRFVTYFLLIPMYVSGGIIPEFILSTKLHLYNTPWALILPGAYSIWYIILVRSYFHSIPESLRESAKIDGANSYQILWNVFLPTSKPILAVMVLYYAVSHWNSYFNALLYLSDQNRYPLQLILRAILIQNQASEESFSEIGNTYNRMLLSETMKYALIIVSCVPVLILYPFLQKYFVQGVMIGSVKG